MKRESQYPWLIWIALSSCSPSTISYVPRKVSNLIHGTGTDINTVHPYINETPVNPQTTNAQAITNTNPITYLSPITNTNQTTNTNLGNPPNSVTSCIVDTTFNQPGYVASGSCYPTNDACPKGFTKITLTPTPYPGTQTAVSSCQLLPDNGQRCTPDPKFTFAIGSPIGSCLPTNGSCPNLFVLVKSTSPLDSIGCSYVRDATL